MKKREIKLLLIKNPTLYVIDQQINKIINSSINNKFISRQHKKHKKINITKSIN